MRRGQNCATFIAFSGHNLSNFSSRRSAPHEFRAKICAERAKIAIKCADFAARRDFLPITVIFWSDLPRFGTKICRKNEISRPRSLRSPSNCAKKCAKLLPRATSDTMYHVLISIGRNVVPGPPAHPAPPRMDARVAPDATLRERIAQRRFGSFFGRGTPPVLWG